MSTGWVFWVNGAHLVLVTTECTRFCALIHPVRLTSGFALDCIGDGWRGLVGVWGDTPGASRGGEYFLTDKSSLSLRVAPCRVSEFSCHARTRIKLVG